MSPEEVGGFSVAFRSDHELVLVKPAGVASELTSDSKRVSLLSRVQDAGFPEARLPHRLDRVTRGFLLVATSPESIRFHNEQVRARAWSKFYLARVCDPDPSPPSGSGDGSDQGPSTFLLGEHRAYLRRRGDRMEAVRSGGQPSLLRVLSVAPSPGRPGESHVVVELLTGRYHQVRVMLANLGAPLVGDRVYGSSVGPFYLEHAGFAFRPFEGRATVRLFDREDPIREPVAPGIVETLASTLSDPTTPGSTPA